MFDEVVVSREMLRAMGADTRINILKALKERQKTQSELAKELELSPPTILEHVEQLEKAELVERIPGERKWKYYKLTSTGRSIVEKRRMNVVMLIAGSSVAVFGALMVLYLLVPVMTQAMLPSNSGVSTQPTVEPTSGQIAYALTDLQSSSTAFLGVLIMLVSLATVFLVGVAIGYSLRKRI